MNSPRWDHKRALKFIGLPGDLDVGIDANYERAMDEYKRLVVAARLVPDDSKASTLSLCKNLIKKRWENQKNKICKCGRRKTLSASQCQICRRMEHYPPEIGQAGPVLHQLEPLQIIPPVKIIRSPVHEALELLAGGHIGDSFVTNRTKQNIHHLARCMGGTVTSRIADLKERDKKKRQWRVWRTDGRPMEEVNDIILRRKKGEDIPKPPAWVAPSEEVLKALNKSRHRKKKTIQI